jgi:hypothetical protein
MSIKPFTDAGVRDLNREITRTTATARSGTLSLSGTFDRIRQGVSIRSNRQYFNRMLPVIISADPPTFTDEPIIPYLEISNYGQPKLFNDPGPDGTAAPFEDIVGRFSGKDYLQDEGTQIYPSILENPTLRDPGQMDGVIEPLAIRGTISNFSLGQPYVAHTVKGALMSGFRDHSNKGAEVISQIQYFSEPSRVDFFEDNSERLLGDVMAPGFISETEPPIVPFEDSQIATNPSASFSFLSGAYRDRGELGTTYRSTASGIIFNPSNVGNTGNTAGRISTTVLGTDSIAFGGLKK